MTVEVFDSVWDAVEESPEGSLNMRFRSDLMMRIGRCISEWGVSQKQAAHRLAITQARLSDLLEGRINQFSLEELLKIAETADIKVEMMRV